MAKIFTGPNNLQFSYVGIRVRADVRQQLEKLAAQEEVTISHIFRWAIREYLERHQWTTNPKTQAPGTAT